MAGRFFLLAQGYQVKLICCLTFSRQANTMLGCIVGPDHPGIDQFVQYLQVTARETKLYMDGMLS